MVRNTAPPGLISATLIRVVWYSTWVLVALITCRLLLKLFGADPASRFASLIYQVTFPPLIPFFAIVPTPQYGPVTVEFFALIAIVCYLLLGRAIAGFIDLFGPVPAD
ncbi:MAG TPA: hypothetical protein VHL09_02345 [Dehalococcoidia bacterium]|nr:hypothetical protein [Dehalococcoidia bacterium]